LAEQLSDSSDSETAPGRSRSPSAHSVQSRACSEPEPCSDWLLLDDISASRGYSSECEACCADVADDSEDENVQQNDLPTRGPDGAGSSDSLPAVLQQNAADVDDVFQNLVDVDSEFVASASIENRVICDSVKPTVLEDAFVLSSEWCEWQSKVV